MEVITLYTGVVVLLTFSSAVTYWEWKRDGTIITPFAILAWPYTLVVALINIAGIHYTFYPVRLSSILFCLTGMLFFAAGGRMVSCFAGNGKGSRSFHVNRDTDRLAEVMNFFAPLFICLALVSIAAGIYHFQLTLRVLGGGLLVVVMPAFEEQYAHGFWGHIIQVGRPAFTFLTAYYFMTRKKHILLLLILTLAPIIIAQIKVHIVTTLMAGLFFSIMIGAVRLNIKKILIYGILAVGLFNLVYIITYSQFGLADTLNSKMIRYMVYNFFSYLFGGPIAFSEVFGDALFPLFSYKEIFAVPLNFYNSWYGGGATLTGITPYFIQISSNYRVWHSANIFTIFGHLYIYMGAFPTMIYLWCIGVIFYYIRSISLRNIGVLIGYCFTLSMFSVSFFDLLLNKLQPYETFLMSVAFPAVYQIGYKIVIICNRHLEMTTGKIPVDKQTIV